jgi:hypothetical protein
MEKKGVATIYGKRQTERSGENHLMTTTFVGRDFEETRKTGEVLKKPRKTVKQRGRARERRGSLQIHQEPKHERSCTGDVQFNNLINSRTLPEKTALSHGRR